MTEDTKKPEIPADLKKKLKARSRVLDPLVRVGKNGLTDSMLQHIKMLVKKKQLVKVKLLRSFVETGDKKKIAVELAEKTGGILLDQVGFTVVLYNPKIRRQ